MANVTLSAGVRSNLLSLQQTSSLISTTQGRLSTGLKVASPIDDAVAYFQGKGLSDKASDFADKKDGIDQGISSLKSSLNAIDAVEKVVKQMKGLLLSAKSSTLSERQTLKAQFSDLAKQVGYLANDATYQGLNLANSTSSKLTVSFSDQTAAKLVVNGVNLNTSKLVTGNVAPSKLATALANDAWTKAQSILTVSKFDTAIAKIDAALNKLRGNAKALGANVALLQTRLDFTKSHVNNLTEGSGKLTLADLNEEGANLVALQTRQQLSVQALQFAGQSDQSVMQLFR